MKTYNIAVIPGDGIGQEVVPAAVAVLEAVAADAGFRFEWQHFDWGSQRYFDHGQMMPADAIAQGNRHRSLGSLLAHHMFIQLSHNLSWCQFIQGNFLSVNGSG